MGPDVLWCGELPSGDLQVVDPAVDNPEVCKVVVHKTSTTENSLLKHFLKFSSWTRLVKAIARLMQRIKELKGVAQRTNKATTLKERKDAELTIIGIVQREVFSAEIQSLQHKREITTKNKPSRLYRLNPFLDQQGILRVGSRLKHAALHPHIKHLLGSLAKDQPRIKVTDPALSSISTTSRAWHNSE